MKNKKLFVTFIAVIIIGVIYNLYRIQSRPTGNFRCGSQEIADSELRNYYVFCYDTLRVSDTKTIKKPLYAILWKARKAGSASGSSWHLVKMINDRKVSIPKKEMAIYSLQSDFTLSIMPLREVEKKVIFELLSSPRKTGPFYKNEVWQSQVAPNLLIVEVPDK